LSGNNIGQINQSACCAQQIRNGMKRDVFGMRFAVRHVHISPAARQRGRFADEPALADARRPDDADHLPTSTSRLFDGLGDAVDLTLAPDERRLPPARLGTSGMDRQELTGRYARVATLDPHELRLTQVSRRFDEPCGGLAEHHPAGPCDGLHPLGHADLFADRGVSRGARGHFTSDHLAGIQADTQLQCQAVAVMHIDRLALHRLLQLECRTAGA